MTGVFVCPLCAQLTILYGDERREDALACAADHMAFCPAEHADPRLVAAVEAEGGAR